jgi:multimeric flavodoxin WrbA
MNIALVNGSPKFKNSVSGNILNSLKPNLQDNNIIEEYVFRTNEIKSDDLEHISKCNVIVFAFPLYVDGIPSHLLRCLDQMEKFLSSNTNNEIYVYTIINIGFYEGKQAALAIEMMKNWAEKANVKWGQGIGIGGGGMMSMIEKSAEGKGLMKSAYNSLTSLANNIILRTSSDEIYTTPGIPRIVYKIGGEMGWRQTAKENGLKTKDLFLKR